MAWHGISRLSSGTLDSTHATRRNRAAAATAAASKAVFEFISTIETSKTAHEFPSFFPPPVCVPRTGRYWPIFTKKRSASL